MDENGERRRAREIAQARYLLRLHALVYVVVNVGLLLTWWNTGRGYFWPGYPIFFWGIGVVAHYLTAQRTTGHGWIDRETERILRERERESEGPYQN
jgi:hypothetical protein